MKTKVIFRKFHPLWDAEVIALFPALAGDSNPSRTCLSYQHTGQHGAAVVDIPEWTFPASPAEYQALKTELESLGYDLRVCKRFSHKDLLARIEQTKG